MLIPNSIRIHLKRGMFIRVRKGAGKVITAHAGSVWITEQDNPSDVVLYAGQSFEIARQGVALVEALGDASISLEPTSATPTLLP